MPFDFLQIKCDNVPVNLTSKNIDLISGEAVLAEVMIPAVISIALSILGGVLLAIRLFNKKQL